MTDRHFNKRRYDVFASYSHADGTFVQQVITWLEQHADIKVWYDKTRLTVGDRLEGSLVAAIENARAALFFVSKHSTNSTWCEDEYNAALQQRRQDKRYKIVVVNIDGSIIKGFKANSRYLNFSETLDWSAATDLLEALVTDTEECQDGDRDVYLSRPWHGTEYSNDFIGLALEDQAFRMIGDAPDNSNYSEQRVKGIIETCGALVATLPFRNDPANSCTSKYIIQEICIALELGRPCLVFAAKGVQPRDDIVRRVLGQALFPAPQSNDDPILGQAIELLADAYRTPTRIAFSFFAASLRNDADATRHSVSLIERVTGMRCYLGQNLSGGHAQSEIIHRIRNAQFVIADISENNLNSLIEAGIARGAGTALHLICSLASGENRKTRFMFSDMEVNWYSDLVERAGIIHRIARMYRRRIYKQEAS